MRLNNFHEYKVLNCIILFVDLTCLQPLTKVKVSWKNRYYTRFTTSWL